MKLLKKITIMLLTAISSFGYSQNLEPVKDRIEYKKDFADCWKVILDPKDDEVKKVFKKFIKKRYHVKLKGKGLFGRKDIISAEDIVFTKISSKRINFYASIADVDGQTELKLFASYGLSLLFGKDKHEEEFNAIRGVLVDFINTYLPEYHTELLEVATKRYEKFVKEDEKLNEKYKDNKKEIEKLQSENQDLADKIKENKEDLVKEKENLTKTQEKFNGVKKQLTSIRR